MRRHARRAAALGLGAIALFVEIGTANAGEARFLVSDTVVNAALEPFGANIGRIGNGAALTPIGAGFEPVVFRDKIVATVDATDRIVASRRAMTIGGRLREGALDGATVDLYRIENGAVRRVRRDVVSDGGHAASGWTVITPRGRLAPRDAPRYDAVLPKSYRADAPLWFAVRAVSRGGAASSPSAAVRVVSPTDPKGGKSPTALAPAPAAAEISGAAPAAPTGLSARALPDGTFRLAWTASPDPDVVGYAVLRSQTDPAAHRGYHLDLDPGAGPPVRAGDVAILSKKFYDAARPGLFADAVWGARVARRLFNNRMVPGYADAAPDDRWSLIPHGDDTPVAEAGETHLRLVLGPERRRMVGLYNHAGPEHPRYPTLEPRPYRVEVWLRADRPGVVRFRFQGPYAKMIAPVSFEVGPQWRRHVHSFTPPERLREGRPGRMVLEFVGPGVFDVDNFRVYEAAAPYLAPTRRWARRLEEAGGGALRGHMFVKTGRESYDLDQFTNSQGVISAVRGLSTLPHLLSLAEASGADPWLQIEPHFSPEEWRGLIEYLAAPFDPERHDVAARPWAAKRRAQGRAAPWTDAFDRILLEVGNETWNKLFRPWTFERAVDAATGERLNRGTVYGLFLEHAIAAMRASPWWAAAELDDRIEFVIGGRRAAPRYGLAAAAAAPSADWLTIATYNGGWDENDGPPTQSPPSYFSVLHNVSWRSAPTARRLVDGLARIGRPDLRLGTYEAGPGYAVDGLGGVELSQEQRGAQEAVMKSQAAGVATLDAFLAQAAAGFDLQSFFAFGEGRGFSAFAPERLGGGAYPSWALLSLFNREALGDMLAVEPLEVPRVDLPKGPRRRPAIAGAPATAAYATRRGDRLALVLISRRLPGFPDADDDGFTPTRVALPIRTARRVTLHRLAGPFDAHAAEGDGPPIETVELAPPADYSDIVIDERFGADARGLPPASALLYVFDGAAPMRPGSGSAP